MISLSSDSITNSYRTKTSLQPILKDVDKEVEEFRNLSYTIGGFILFPSKRIDGQMTINGARGFNGKIADRFDLTLECIRLHYLNQPNPLESVLKVNSNFFDLFTDFRGYVEFFLLQDLVQSDLKSIHFFTDFEVPFETSPLPRSASEYLIYKQRNMKFLNERNRRISSFK
jgi:hypothetical protein